MGSFQAEGVSAGSHPAPRAARASWAANRGCRDAHLASHLGLLPLGVPGWCCRPGSQAEAEAWGRLGRPPACSGRGPVWLSSPGVPPTCPCSPVGGSGRLLAICALISLPGASWSGGAYQGSAPVRWAFRSPWVKGGGGSPYCRAWRLPQRPWPSHPLTPAAGCLLYHIRIQNIA